jgi:SprA-related family
MIQAVSPNLVNLFVFGARPQGASAAEDVPPVAAESPSGASNNNVGPSGTSSGQGQTAGGGSPSSSKTGGQNQQGGQSNSATGSRLTTEQQVEVAQLAQIDRHVRAHEQAHLSAAGSYARSGPSYSYTTGPDGKLYAVGGEVSIDVSPVANDPAATIAKMRVVEAAANAPADPSPQDRQVAAAAVQTEIQASLDLAAQQAEEAKPSTASKSGDPRIAAYTKGQEAVTSQLIQLVA